MDKKVYRTEWTSWGTARFTEVEVTETQKTYKVCSVTDIVGGWYPGHVIRKSDSNIFTDRQVALDTLIEDGYEIVKGLEKKRRKVLDDITGLKRLASRD